jgi:hypothetical protein
MFQKTKISPNLLRWLCTTLLAAAVYVFWFRSTGELYLPWIVAFGVTINEGIRRYAGDSFAGGDIAEQYRILAALVVGYVIIPTLFLSSWRRIMRDRIAVTAGQSVLFIVTGAITFVLFIPSFWEAIEMRNNSVQTETKLALQSEKDELMQDLTRLAYDAYLYRLLPSSSGGGDNSYVGYKPPAGAVSSSGSRYVVTHVEHGLIRFRAVSALYDGSAVGAEIDSTGKIKRFAYEGMFSM